MEGQRRICGYFAVFGSPYVMWDGSEETLDPHVFDDQLSGDVRALIDHQTWLVLGRTIANTLALRVDDHGLWGEILVNPNDSDAMNLYARVQRKDVTQCSFGFDILDEDVEYRENGTAHYHVRKIALYEVSCCTFPAYEETEIAARSANREKDLRTRRTDAWAHQMKERLKNVWH